MSELVDDFKKKFEKDFFHLPYDKLEASLNHLNHQLHINDRIYLNNWLEKFIIINKIETKNSPLSETNITEHIYKNTLLKLWLKKSSKFSKHPKISNSKCDIIDVINFDLNLVEEFFEYQINTGEALRYFLALNRNFLDFRELGRYLRETDNLNIYKKTILENLIRKVDKILKLYQDDLKEIEKLTDEKKIWNSFYIEGYGTYSFNKNYKTFKISDLSYHHFSLATREMRVRIFNHNVVKEFDNWNFASNCNQVLGRITGYLGINTNEELDNFLINGDNISSFSPETQNPYKNPNIFRDSFASNFFQSLRENIEGAKYPIAEYSYIYRKMYSEKLLHESVKPLVFRNFLHGLNLLSSECERLKQLSEIGNQVSKEQLYYHVKNNMKS